MDAALKDAQASCRGKNLIVRFASAHHGHGLDVLNCGPNHVFLKENATRILLISCEKDKPIFHECSCSDTRHIYSHCLPSKVHLTSV